MEEEVKDNALQEQKRAPRPRKRRRVLRWTLGILAGLLAVIAGAILSLYIPGMPKRVLGLLSPYIEKNFQMKVEARTMELRFPCTLEVSDLIVYDLQARGDTMIAARRAELDIAPSRLLKGSLSVSRGSLSRGLYRMGGPDSMYIQINIDSAALSGRLGLMDSRIVLDRTDIHGGLVDMIIGPDSATAPVDTTAAPIEVRLPRARINNVRYALYMSETQDTVSVIVRSGDLTDGRIMVYPDSVDLFARTVTLDIDSALYGTVGATPAPGLNMSWLTMKDANVRIDTFTMHRLDLTVPFSRIEARSFIGMPVTGSGVYAQTEEEFRARNVVLDFNDRTRLNIDASMGFEVDSLTPAPFSLTASGQIYPPFLEGAFPAMAPLLKPLPRDAVVLASASLAGTTNDVRIDTLGIKMPSVFELRMAGSIANFDSISNLEADMSLTGSIENPRPFSSMLPDGIKLPPLSMKGKLRAAGGKYSADLTARTRAGRLALQGSLAGSAPGYKLNLRADSFPVAAFMPDYGIGAVSGTVSASGSGFDPTKPATVLNTDVNITGIDLNGRRLSGIELAATLANGELNARLSSAAKYADMAMKLTAAIAPGAVSWDMSGAIRRLDLHALGMTDSVMTASMGMKARGYATFALDSVSATAAARNLAVTYGSDYVSMDSLGLRADAGRATRLSLGNSTVSLDFDAPAPPKEIMTAFGNASAAAASMIEQRNVRPDSLVSLLPRFNMELRALPGNPLNSYLASSDTRFGTLTANVRRDSAFSADARILSLSYGENIKIDTLRLGIFNRDDKLFLNTDMRNRPGTLDEFARVNLRGTVAGHSGKFFLEQQNLRGETGYKLGFILAMVDSVIAVQISPDNPIIAYKEWTVNKDNFVAVNPDRMRIHANLDARGAGSHIQLLTSQQSDSLHTDAPNDVTLRVDDIHIQDWLQLNPFAPPIAGNFSADLKINYSPGSVTGYGTASIADLKYGKQTVGNFGMNLDVATSFSGAVHAQVSLDVNGKRAITAIGALNDTTLSTPVNMHMQMREFPLDVANPFLPASMSQLSGSISGRMSVTGRSDSLRLNGGFAFNDARIKVGMIGSTFTLDSIDIPIESNIVRFNGFNIYGSNANPLAVNGTVNLLSFADPRMDLSMTARNMQVINSQKRRGVDIFGRGFIDLDAAIKGSMQFVNVNANLAVLPASNLTYQMSEAAVAAGLQPEEDVVRFVNFADTTQVAVADTIRQQSTVMLLTALLDIRQGSQFTVNLSSDGTNRAVIRGHGVLDYTQNPSVPDGRLTGRFDLDGGYFRYSLPVISELNFNLQRGSYIAFNGPVLNPTINIMASEELKANVTAEGQNSRLVNFQVGLTATGTLEKMNVGFDLSTRDDITVQNELQSMSPAQRANQAMNLMLYGIYSGAGTTANANLSGLYGFLTSQLNSWAANSIKGVDLTFGVDQFNRTLDGNKSSTMQYSYKVSKSLFNDRFKIIVGGNYSTDADANENLAQNLISDISFEYMINQSGTMLVRLFRHTGFESILEGEITQTGVGFVIRRKVRRIADIFNFIKAARQ